MLDLLLNPELLASARQFFEEQTKTTKWESLIPPGVEPPIHLNRDRMDKVRPQLEKLKYDPSKSDDMAALERHVALIRERQIPVVNAGRYKPTQVAQLVATKLGRAFKVHNHTQAWKMYGVRNSGEDPEGCNTKYCQFDSVHRDYVYTEEWVAYLVQKLSDEEEYRRLKAFRLQ